MRIYLTAIIKRTAKLLKNKENTQGVAVFSECDMTL